MSRSEKAHKMFELVEAWRASGQSRYEFCAGHDIKVSKLAYWIQRKKSHDRQFGTPAAEGFITVDPTEPAADSPKLALRYPNGVTLELSHPDEQLIARLIRLW